LLIWARLPAAWTVLFVALGLALRGYHYGRDAAMWCDEASVVLNVIDKDYGELLGPLRHSATGPPLFFFVERWAAVNLGDSTLSLRLFPFLASCAALVLLVLAARRLTPALAWPWIAFLCAFSDHLLWHAFEAKPYAGDVLVAALVLFAIAYARDWPLDRQLLSCAALAPLALGFSYPSCFIVAAIGIVMLGAVYREGRLLSWLLYGLFAATVMVTVLLLALGPIHHQQSDSGMFQCWVQQFPDWSRPWRVPGLAGLRLLEAARYASEPIGHVLCLAALVGAVYFWRTGQHALVALLLVPLGLNVLAYLAWRYPLGAYRVNVYAAPALMLLMGMGIHLILEWAKQRGRLGQVLVVTVVLISAIPAIQHVVRPWMRPDLAQAAQLIKAELQPGELVAGHCWEHEYYFRDCRTVYRAVEKDRGIGADRVWLLTSDGNPVVRRAVLGLLEKTASWQVLRQEKLTGVTIYHLRRSQVAATAERTLETSD
jgi:hypothetical protein